MRKNKKWKADYKPPAIGKPTPKQRKRAKLWKGKIHNKAIKQEATNRAQMNLYMYGESKKGMFYSA